MENKTYFEIDVLALGRKCLKKWKFILAFCLLFYIVGCLFVCTIPKEYTAAATLAPERARSSSAKGFSTFASMAGISLPTATSDAMTPSLFPDIAKSAPFIVELFDVPLSFEQKGEIVSTDIKGYFLNYVKKPWWKSVLSFPRKMFSWIKSVGKHGFEDVVEENKEVDLTDLSPLHSMLIGAISGSTSVSIDKKTYLIVVSAKAWHPEAARDICDAVTARLQSYCENYYTSKARKDLEYYESLLADAKHEYYSAQQKYAVFLDSNQGVVLQSRLAESVRLQNEMDLQYALYTSCAQQVQQARAQVQKETPVFTVINPASNPFFPSYPSRKTIPMLFLFIGFIASVVIVLLKHKKIRLNVT